jgi:hypothetical protein
MAAGGNRPRTPNNEVTLAAVYAFACHARGQARQ